MGKRGPKPKPRELVLLEGNPSRKPILPDEVTVTSVMPLVKPDLVEDRPIASAEWDRIVTALPPGLLSALDVGVLTQYALAWELLHQAQRKIDDDGLVIWGEKGARANPAVGIWKIASDTLNKTGDLLGLNPSTRSRLQMPSRNSNPAQGGGPQTSASKFLGLFGKT